MTLSLGLDRKFHWTKHERLSASTIPNTQVSLIVIPMKSFSDKLQLPWRMTDGTEGPYIKYVGGEGERRAFLGVMKYFRRILMGHEIFFKSFDGPQNIFSCSIFLTLFFKLKSL